MWEPPFAMRLWYSCPEDGSAAVGAIRDAERMQSERRVTESICHSSRLYSTQVPG
jgi:hypothetical protein